MSNEPQSVLNASTDSVASANFIALHEKISANEERLKSQIINLLTSMKNQNKKTHLKR